jgi:hypothetical protein
MFAACWILLEIGWPLLILFGIASAGSVWSIPAVVPCIFILAYGLLLVNGSNIIRTLILQFSQQRDNLVKAIARGYLWSILSIGVMYLVHAYFIERYPLLFWMPILYLVPINAIGTTVPIPIPLGVTGNYLQLLIIALVYVIGITGACVGGIEILRYLMNQSKRHGAFGSIFNLLMLAVFPALNIYLSYAFLSSVIDLVGGLTF